MKKISLLAIFILLLVPAAICAEKTEVKTDVKINPKVDTKTLFYPKASVEQAIYKYKAGNFTECLQQGLSVLIKDPKHPVANYYVGLAFAKVDDKDSAMEYLDRAATLSNNSIFVGYAQEAKQCILGASSCVETEDEQKITRFIRSSDSSGLTELNRERQNQELEIIKKRMNSDKFINENFRDDRLAMASDEEILHAIKTLKDSGVSITVNMAPNYMQDPQMMEQMQQMQQMQMFTGGGNNNGNNNFNAAMSLIPMMMMQSEQNGKNIDPQVIQAIMMQSMMPDFGNFGAANK